MELLECQAKELLQRFHLPCPPHVLVVKGSSPARILALGGGLLIPQVRGEMNKEEEKVAATGEEALALVKEMFQKNIFTNESGPKGFAVEKILFLPNLSKEKELSLWVGICPSGEILVRVKEGERLFSEIVPERRTLFRYQLARLVASLSLPLSLKENLCKAIEGVLAALFHYDASSIEIDPFIVTEGKTLLAFRVRMSVDERALFRQREMKEFVQDRQRSEREKRIHSPFPYHMEEGSIGCLANGRGLGEYTATLVRKKGGTVAGVLDIGDVCHEENIAAGLQALVRDPSVNAVCINLFTGLVDGQKVVSTILKTLSTVSGGVIPGRCFLRLEGTNAGRGILLAGSSSILKVTQSLDEAVHFAVETAKG